MLTLRVLALILALAIGSDRRGWWRVVVVVLLHISHKRSRSNFARDIPGAPPP